VGVLFTLLHLSDPGPAAEWKRKRGVYEKSREGRGARGGNDLEILVFTNTSPSDEREKGRGEMFSRKRGKGTRKGPSTLSLKLTP